MGALDRQALIETVRRLVRQRIRGWISYVNIDAVNQAIAAPWLREFINASLFTYCDGMGVLLGARMLGERIPERITLADCMDELCRMLEKENARVFLLGGSDETVAKAVDALGRRFPGLSICGYSHGFFDLSNGIDIQRKINAVKPDIVFVGMGMPRQEAWIRKNWKNLDATLFWSAGALFEFLAGSRKRCPQWMAKSGFEWLYRLAQEPRRLWRRYIVGNPQFLLRILKLRLEQGGPGDPSNVS
ncbi:MAG: hypothetical protein HBSIN02_24220 [Bacteroidia bacterium]|nr:MAG: hypothetical protein HBSIN02_24220 [Bacteroidia bacterium]